jgi:hypothetical protein
MSDKHNFILPLACVAFVVLVYLGLYKFQRWEEMRHPKPAPPADVQAMPSFSFTPHSGPDYTLAPGDGPITITIPVGNKVPTTVKLLPENPKLGNEIAALQKQVQALQRETITLQKVAIEQHYQIIAIIETNSGKPETPPTIYDRGSIWEYWDPSGALICFEGQTRIPCPATK